MHRQTVSTTNSPIAFLHHHHHHAEQQRSVWLGTLRPGWSSEDGVGCLWRAQKRSISWQLPPPTPNFISPRLVIIASSGRSSVVWRVAVTHPPAAEAPHLWNLSPTSSTLHTSVPSVWHPPTTHAASHWIKTFAQLLCCWTNFMKTNLFLFMNHCNRESLCESFGINIGPGGWWLDCCLNWKTFQGDPCSDWLTDWLAVGNNDRDGWWCSSFVADCGGLACKGTSSRP